MIKDNKNNHISSPKKFNKTIILNKQIINYFIFLIPFIILLIGIIAYFIIIPTIYDKNISSLNSPYIYLQDILDIFHDPNTLLLKIYNINSIQIFWYLLIISFIISLFIIGKRIHTKSEPHAINATLIKKEPYLIIKDISNLIKQAQNQHNNKELNSLIYAIKCLEEKLSIESDFGFGNNDVINCENKIAQQLQFLIDKLTNTEIINEINLLNVIILKINLLLDKRSELKKK